MTLRTTLLASAMLALPLVAANAQVIDGPYVAGGAGINILQDLNPKISNATGSATGHTDADIGPVVVMSLGWGFGNGLRAELEGDYRNNTFHGFGGGGAMPNA